VPLRSAAPNSPVIVSVRRHIHYVPWPTVIKSKLSAGRWLVGISLVISAIVSYAATRVLIVGSWWGIPLSLAWLGVLLCGVGIIAHGATRFPRNEPPMSEPSHELRVPPNSTPHPDTKLPPI
jgi:hypothetical protein